MKLDKIRNFNLPISNLRQISGNLIFLLLSYLNLTHFMKMPIKSRHENCIPSHY